ncbi:inositol polyphosphate kinase domain-containing protein [Ditylenchus destructor]|nr:inositol polyphosphate kinase domain-containing protein [Ditylenchus destructor]
MALLLAYAGYPDRYNDHFPSNSSLLDQLREYPTDEIPIALKASPFGFKFQLALGIVFVADAVCYGIIIWCSYRIVTSVNKAFAGMTERSRLRDINKQLTYTLIAQASLPALMLGGVSFAVILSLFFMKDPSSIYNFVYLTVPFTWLPMLSPLITILILMKSENVFLFCTVLSSLYSLVQCRQVTGRLSQVLSNVELRSTSDSTSIESTKTEFEQAKGHKGVIRPIPNGIFPGIPDNSLGKLANKMEFEAVEVIKGDKHLEGLTPEYYTSTMEVRMEVDDGKKKEMKTYLPMSNAYDGFEIGSRVVIDIKMGIRTFLVREMSKTKERPDLFEKSDILNYLDPEIPLPEERTKADYLDYRDRLSSTRTLGFRIDATIIRNEESIEKEYKKLRKEEDVLSKFNELFSHCEARYNVGEKLVERLEKVMLPRIEESIFFKTHEVIGSSLLIVCDSNHINVLIIDFGKSEKLPKGETNDHRKEWIKGENREDGYLTGFGNLIKIFKRLNPV